MSKLKTFIFEMPEKDFKLCPNQGAESVNLVAEHGNAQYLEVETYNEDQKIFVVTSEGKKELRRIQKTKRGLYIPTIPTISENGKIGKHFLHVGMPPLNDHVWELCLMATKNKKEWGMISSLNWDGDYERCKNELKIKYSSFDIDSLERFCYDKMVDLGNKFNEDWKGISDDSWQDLRAEVIGRGQQFYESVTLEKLEEMETKLDYHESFLYCFQ